MSHQTQATPAVKDSAIEGVSYLAMEMGEKS